MSGPYVLRHTRSRPRTLGTEETESGTYNGHGRRTPKAVSSYEPDELGDLLVSCWCRRDFVRVNVRLVRECQTDTCGRERCHP